MSDDKDLAVPAEASSAAPSANTPASPAGNSVSFHEAFVSAYRNLWDKLEAAWHPVEICQAVMEAESELQKRLAAFPGPGQELERCEATAEYLRTVRALCSPERQKAKIAHAYSRYLDELRAIWSRSDIDSIEPQQLSAFGESIAWAGYYAGLRPST